MDESAERLQSERIETAEKLADADDRLVELEAERAELAADRLRVAELSEADRARQAAADAQFRELRDEVEGLARLLIDAPTPLNRAA